MFHDKFTEIQRELTFLEKQESITVLWACESGSRAWGFESKDSDFDVRFIYLRRTECYLRASDLRDVIEKPISDDLDISGWDLPKALGLFRKSNPPLFEWLQSPIIYRRNNDFYRMMTELMPCYFSPMGCMYYYMSMADRNRRNYLNHEQIKIKKYFYMLRPILACIWIHSGFGVPPIEFQKMLDRILPHGDLREAIDLLAERKRSGQELDLEPQIPIISEFILKQTERFTAVTKETQFTNAWGPLDAMFLQMLIAINGNRIEQAGGANPCSLAASVTEAASKRGQAT